MLSFLRAYYPTVFNRPLAAWLGVSLRTLNRKAAELGLSKIENFNQVRNADIQELASDALKRAYRAGRRSSNFKKGVRNNPGGEFKPGHEESPEVRERRIEAIRRTFRKRKLLSIYGLKTSGNGDKR